MLKNIRFPFLSTRIGKLMFLALTLVFLGSVGLDQVSKRHAHGTLLTWEHETNKRQFRTDSYHVFTLGEVRTEDNQRGEYFRFKFQYQRNTGAAFSMLADLDDTYRVPFFYAVTLIAIFFVSYYLKTLPLNYHVTRLGLVLILSGAIGNFLDRVVFGYVIDFLDVDWNLFGWHHDFAVFNIADVAINLGIICFIIESLLRKKPVEVTLQGELIASK
ncbi:signal peptidase II [Pseudobacteriovorax antillogorgiicola]|uniref:Lipoprotein signal peptidase n=1 Tax=Pseudobacteriovorax antillogorgiicola TaxID=1513793 RepID=A0A1Y6BNN5_9BACT|nr:signal peptidase II [Pseudobacteriovorax antillogorgiicola]TCS53925.1 lipoprotein signal peptidase [Pseudobacteriovorax antillogorgiicola]SMF20518.1 lipoprotein signal peptidase [Pseudobacteriovorax antillogorgiicola]